MKRWNPHGHGSAPSVSGPIPEVVDFRLPGPPPPDFISPSRGPIGKMVVLGATETLFYYWGDHNSHPWETVIDRAHAIAKTSTWQRGDPTGILLTPGGSVILSVDTDDTCWPGVMCRYTMDVRAVVAELKRRGIIGDRTKIYDGNWAGQRGVLLGTASEVMAITDAPPEFLLYHGTNDVRAPEILKRGLIAMPVGERMWKGRIERGHPEYRDTAVYLATTYRRAASYAEKAVRVARAHGHRGTKPVVLQVVVDRALFPNLRADDDFLSRAKREGRKASEGDWEPSLAYFGQVALIGGVEPSRISVAEDREVLVE
jgi:hypothetical protein